MIASVRHRMCSRWESSFTRWRTGSTRFERIRCWARSTPSCLRRRSPRLLQATRCHPRSSERSARHWRRILRDGQRRRRSTPHWDPTHHRSPPALDRLRRRRTSSGEGPFGGSSRLPPRRRSSSAAIVVFQSRPRVVPLTDKDVLVLADFANDTGEPVFDVTLREALAAQLEQSPFLKVMDDAAVRQSLRLMGRAAGDRVTNEIAREVCVREREKAMIDGSIASLGNSYAIILRATGCEDGETLAREQVEAEDKEHVLAALSAAASAMRTRLGESLASIQPLERHQVMAVTTPSLDAFQAYARGTDLYRQGLSLQAIPFFQRAVELDPGFAMAFQLLGNAYANAWRTGAGGGLLEAGIRADRPRQRTRAPGDLRRVSHARLRRRRRGGRRAAAVRPDVPARVDSAELPRQLLHVHRPVREGRFRTSRKWSGSILAAGYRT